MQQPAQHQRAGRGAGHGGELLVHGEQARMPGRAVHRADVASSDVEVAQLKGGVEVVRIAAFTRGVGTAW